MVQFGKLLVRGNSRQCSSVCLLRQLSTYFAQSHEYVHVNGDMGTVGMTNFGIDILLGTIDSVYPSHVDFIELPKVGTKFSQGDPFGLAETAGGKVSFPVYLPVAGEVVERNEELESNPGVVEESAMEDGWFIKIKIQDEGELKGLMNESAYKEYLKSLS